MRRVVGPLRAILLLAVLTAGVARAQFVPREYYPLEPGNFWTYRVEPTLFSTVEVDAGVELVGGVATTVVEQRFNRVRPDSPQAGDRVVARSFYTNDTQGLRLHQALAQGVPFGPAFIDVETTPVPPQLLSPAVAPLGSVLVAQGVQDVVLRNGNDTAELHPDYQTTTTIGATPEIVSVPAGVFDAIRVTQEIVTAIPGGPVSTTTDVTWYARGVGPVRLSSQTDGGPAVVSELSLFLVSEPSRFALGGSALAVLALLGARRRKVTLDHVRSIRHPLPDARMGRSRSPTRDNPRTQRLFSRVLVRQGEMPPWFYALAHPGAHLSDEERGRQQPRGRLQIQGERFRRLPGWLGRRPHFRLYPCLGCRRRRFVGTRSSALPSARHRSPFSDEPKLCDQRIPS